MRDFPDPEDKVDKVVDWIVVIILFVAAVFLLGLANHLASWPN